MRLRKPLAAVRIGAAAAMLTMWSGSVTAQRPSVDEIVLPDRVCESRDIAAIRHSDLRMNKYESANARYQLVREKRLLVVPAGGGDILVFDLERTEGKIGRYTARNMMITFDAGTNYLTATVVYSDERETRVMRLECEEAR